MAILTTIRAGWDVARSSPDVRDDADEVAMTERLRDGMRSALNNGTLPWGGQMIVARGMESMSRPGLKRPDGLTDIPIVLIEVFLASGDHDPHAIVECKRLAEGNRPLSKAYVAEGIDRFCDGKYASNHSVGFMVAYLIGGDSGRAVAEVNAILIAARRNRETLSETRPAGIVWESQHPRARSTDIALHHTVLLPSVASNRTMAA